MKFRWEIPVWRQLKLPTFQDGSCLLRLVAAVVTPNFSSWCHQTFPGSGTQKKRYEIFWDRRNRSYKLITIDLSKAIQHHPTSNIRPCIYFVATYWPRHPSPAAVPEVMSLPHVMEMKVKRLQWWKHHYPLGIERSYGKWPIYKWFSH